MGGKWPVQLVFRGILLPGFVQISSKQSCVVPINLFLYAIFQRQYGASIQKYWHSYCLEEIPFTLSIVVHRFVRCILTPLSVDDTLLPKYVNLSSNFRILSFRVVMASSRLKRKYSVLLAFMWRLMPAGVCSRRCSRDSAWKGVFAGSAYSSA